MFSCCAPPEDKQPQITITAQEVKPASVTAPALSEKIEEKPPPVVAAPAPEPEATPAPESVAAPAAAAPEPAGPVKANKSDAFDVVLDKAGGKKMGVALNQDANKGKSLAITNVLGDGLVQEYNKTAPRNQQILIGSIILAVDGAEGTPQELVKKMGASPKPTLKIKSPDTKDVTIIKNGAPLGLQMKPILNAKGEPGAGMTVTAIGAGSKAEEFNKANPGSSLKAGDQVVQVCGMAQIVDAVKANDTVVLTIVVE